MNCRFCNTPLKHEFIDLVNSPPSNSLLAESQLNEPEVFYPLRLLVCHECFLVQIDEYAKSTEIFNDDYAYFSSYSTTWLEHARLYVEMISERLRLGDNSLVIEIASNDGYLLRHFRDKAIPCLGIEPARNTAEAARVLGLEVIVDFFGTRLADDLAQSNRRADLLIGNNVLAHVPNINDFVHGLKTALKPSGAITMEFPHLMRLVEGNQFDTIYHEHFSYLSLLTVEEIFETHGLTVFDVEELPSHGGSLRIYARHKEDVSRPATDKLKALENEESRRGMRAIKYYENFQTQADLVKYGLLSFLLEQKRAGKTVAAYGAAAKGNTLLNYCGIKKDLIMFVVDKSPHKQGKYLPGSHIPVVGEEEISRSKPDYILVLPWNIKEEIIEQLSYVRNFGGTFVVPIPSVQLM